MKTAKSKNVQFRVTEGEYASIVFAAKCRQKDLADYLRDLVVPESYRIGMEKLTRQ